MKKYITAVILLFAVSLASIIIFSVGINKSQYQVTYSQTVLSGDPAYTDGIQIESNINMGDHLYWRMNYRISDDIKTVSRAGLKPEEPEAEAVYADAYLTCSDFNNYNVKYANGFAPEKESTDDPHDRIIKDIAVKADAGKTTSVKIPLNKYYAFFPVEFHAENGNKRTDDEEGNVFDYFRFPVPDDLILSVKLTKNKKNKVTEYEFQSNYGLEIISSSCQAGGNAYLSINYMDYYRIGKDGEAETTPLPLSDEYRGIHVIPLSVSEDKYNRLIPDASKTTLMYPTAENVKTLLLEASDDETELYLVTEESGKIYLSVIDRASMNLKQKIYLRKAGKHTGIRESKRKDNQILFPHIDGSFSLITKENGGYKREFSDSLPEATDNKLPYNLDNLDFDFDGERLAMLTVPGYHDDDMLYIYTKDGLKYNGIYHASIQRKNYSPDEMAGYGEIPLKVTLPG